MFIRNKWTSTIVDVDLWVRKADIASWDVVYATEEQGQNLVDTYQDSFERVDVSNTIIQKEVTITTAEVLALNTTPKELVAAPWAWYYLVVDKIVASIDYNSAAYATNTTLEFRYGTATTKVSADIASLLATTADKAQSVWGIEAELACAVNDNIEANVATGDPVTWDSDVKVTITYRIQSI